MVIFNSYVKLPEGNPLLARTGPDIDPKFCELSASFSMMAQTHDRA